MTIVLKELQEMILSIYSYAIHRDTSSERTETQYELLDQLFCVAQKSVHKMPVTIFRLDIVSSIVDVAMGMLPQTDHPNIVRSASLLLTELLNLREYITSESVPSTLCTDAPSWWQILLSELNRIENIFVNSALTGCLVQILGCCPEILADTFGTLLFALLSHGVLQITDLQTLGGQVKELAHRRGSAHCSEDIVMTVILTCAQVKSHATKADRVMFTQSEFLDFCGVVWKVGSGQTNLENLQNILNTKHISL
mmetsp:Transcript_32887/g.33501  ORF Transcript_32887/g.33501 Transcript_32887/m.33501 type:complete len:253 (-) Transcript_32887:44-802(-)